jgi:uncharacterized membrane protein HdeD (DUF308 family)
MTQMYVPEEVDQRGMVGSQSPESFWWLLVLTGLISIGLGVVVLANPSASLETLCVLVGIYLFVAGVVAIVKTASDRSRDAVGILLGIVALIAGVVVIRHPSGSLVAVSLAIGLFFIVDGALDLARAIIGPRRLLHLVRGALLLAAGVVIVSSPHISVKTLAIIAGIALVLNGLFQISEGFLLRSLGRTRAAMQD